MPAESETVDVPGLSGGDLFDDRAGSGANRLPYQGLVEQLVRLVCEVKPPVNIALFGPWGAGKSTVGKLLEAALRDRGDKDGRPPIRFARYDAWRYAGVSLYRSFISETAHQLVGSRSAERYNRLLYQKWSSAGFRLSVLLRSLPAAALTFAIVLVAATAILALLAGLWSTATGEDFFGEIKRQLRTVLPISGVVALLTAAARPFLDAAGFKVEQEAPASAEQFRETLTRLVDEALGRGGGPGPFGKRRSIDEAARVVFFIDELDRCSPQDVVEALRAIKTFLEAERCVFVVAADRDVLEADFEQLPQENPVNEEAPYFSSAGSFLDKVFQYQIPLPPLRGRRLTRFARDLVQERVEQRRGLWFELSGERQGHLLDDVVYALVPSHVRSPRRVKVLLNRFATNARIAQAYGLDPLVRAEEIAKLTVFQLEFPMLAADLRSEPRLPALLLDPPDAPPPPLAALLERYDMRAADGGGQLSGQARPTARLLVGSERPAVLRTQHLDLLRYLQRTSEIADPAPDLVYLEAGGKAFDLEDPSLAERVERLAPDAPDDLLDILRARSAGERVAAARILLELSETAVGREQRNVLTVLLKTLDGLGEDAAVLADRAAQAIRTYLRRQTLPYELLGAALAISESQQVRSPAELTNALLAVGPAWSDTSRAQRMCELADTLEQAQLEAVAPRVAEAFLQRPEILPDALRRPLSSEGVQKLFALRELTDAIDQRLADPGAGPLGGLTLAQELHEAGRPQMSTELVSRTAEPMLRHLESEDAYRVIRSWAERAAFDGTAPGAEGFVLQALRRAPADDWEFWTRRLRDPSAPTAEHAELAFEAISTIFANFRTLEAAHQDAAAEAVYGLGRFLRGFEDPETPWLVLREFEAAAAAGWWRDEAGPGTQRRLHALIFRLADSVPEVASREWFIEEIERWLAGGLRAALEDGASDNPEALAEIRRLASDLSPATAQPILELVGAPGAAEREEEDRLVPEPASNEAERVWSERSRGWEKALAGIGADQETLVAVRALLTAAPSDEQRERIAERLAILERPEPPEARETAELAMWLAAELGESGEGLARSLVSVRPRELRDVLEALRAGGLAVSPALAAAIGHAVGHLGPKSWPATRASTGLHLTLTPKNGARTETVETDVAIVGSGAAGSTLAYRLAEEERDVIVLERGPLVEPSLGRGRVLRQALEHAPGDAGLDVVHGVCIGGPTLASVGVAASPSEDILRRWEQMGMDTAALRKSIGDVRRQLIEPTRAGATVSDRSLASALEASTGQEAGDVRYTAVALDGSEHRAMSTLHSVLPEAQKRFGVDRVRVVSDCLVERIEHRAQRATNARCRLADGRRLDVRADTFVVAAGVPASCELLLDSDLGDLPIGQGVSCNASCLLLAEFSRGRSLAPPGSVAYAELADRGVTLEWRLDGPDRGVAGMPGWFEDVATGRRGGEQWVGVVVTTGLGPGAISRPPTRLELIPDRDDIARLVDGLKLAARSAFALGARRVMPAAARPQDVRKAEDLDRLDRFISEPRSLVLGTTQPLGGNRMGWNREAGVVEDDFRVRELGNVYVCDASVLPTSTTVYPQLTVMALASQAARAILSSP